MSLQIISRCKLITGLSMTCLPLPRMFRSMEPNGIPFRSISNYKKSLLCQSLSKQCSIRYYSDNSPPQSSRKRPSLFFVQNPFTWIVTKLDFIMLKNTWDSEFNEESFRFGTKHAVCTITRLLSESNFNALEGLLTKPAHEDLRRSLETSWSDEQRRNIELEEADIQVAVPRKVHFKKEGNHKHCDVDMSFLAVKPDKHNSKAVIFVEINARFHREFSEFSSPEWIVSSFKMPRFKVINTSKEK